MATTRQLNLKSEADRYRSFGSWPVSYMDPRKLAEAGFYYFNRSDVVKCFCCGVEVFRWERGDDPLRDHQRLNPNCPFIKKMPVGNIPVSRNTNSTSGMLVSRSNDECGPYDWKRLPVTSHLINGNSNENSLEKLGINVTTGPLYTKYATLESRIKSFSTWPVAIKLRPENLSDAGFFYTGNGDQTICFHCGVGLKDWLETDDPWIEHVKWYPKCSYVRLNKGLEFVASVCGGKMTPASPTTIKNIQIPSELKEIVQIKNPIEPSISSSKTEKNITSVSEAKSEEKISSVSQDSKTEDFHMCKICYEEEKRVVFLPCGHLIACVKCASSLTSCAVCREPVTAVVRAFLS